MMVFLCEDCRSGKAPIFLDCCRTAAASARETIDAEFETCVRSGDLRAITNLCHAGHGELSVAQLKTLHRVMSESAEAAEIGDLRAIIALWHAGQELSIKQLETLHRAMSETTVEQMIRSYEFVGRVA